MARPLTYRDAGVDVEGKARLLETLGAAITQTFGPDISPWGGFAGILRLPAGTSQIAITIDGVGTKTVLARRLGQDRVIGSDIVAHCANDLAAAGARPLCFVDYVAMPHLNGYLLTTLIEGMSEMCARLGIPLIGGETAEMPGVYDEGRYDVAGAMVGIVNADLGPARVRAGDQIIGLASTGLHTNGYSLARRLVEDLDLSRPEEDLGESIGAALLSPHRCYAPAILNLLGGVPVHAAAHITGGGLPGNIARILPPGLRAHLVPGWPVPPIFPFLQRLGALDREEMRRVFNLGVGMVAMVSPSDVARTLEVLRAAGETAWVIGEVVPGDRDVVFT